MNFTVPSSRNGRLNTLLLGTAGFLILALFLSMYFFPSGAHEEDAISNERTDDGYVATDANPLPSAGGKNPTSENERQPVELLVALKRGTDAALLAEEHGLILRSTLRSDPDSHIFEAESLSEGKIAREALSSHPDVRSVLFNDPAYNEPLEP